VFANLNRRNTYCEPLSVELERRDITVAAAATPGLRNL
jgi:hypothetical protein